MMQETVRKAPQPPELGALFRDLASPYCPGLSLSACPSPQADSLRKAIAVKFEDGQSVKAITEALVVDYGPSIRGTPEFSGMGIAAFVVPPVVMIVGIFFIQKWLRRNVSARRGTRTRQAIQ